jgi:solute carrier family 34 (sodium-dependent phosphate cotransporter)
MSFIVPNHTQAYNKEEGEVTPLLQPLSVSQISIRVFFAVLALFVFLVSLSLLSSAFRLLSGEVVNEVLTAISNPFVGLFIGLLVTAIIQKSSVTTSIVVALVAVGKLPLTYAVPVVIGANIGTTITAMLVSFAHITKKKEFKRGTSAAAAHNLFNIFVAFVLFPLEVFTHILTDTSVYITQLLKPLSNVTNIGIKGVLDFTVFPVADFFVGLLGSHPWILLPISILLLFITISGFTLILKSVLMGERWYKLQEFVFGTPWRALSWGTLLTASLQSSSLTTSVTVSLVATRKVSLKKAFPFIMGANIGTTITALLASISQSDTALSIAIAHLLFNLFGVIVLFPFPLLRNFVVDCAQFLGKMTQKNRSLGFLYVLVIFFLIPFILIFLTQS